MFSDENGNIVQGTPVGHWDNKFFAVGNKTEVVIDLVFDEEADFKMMVEMGFEGGLTSWKIFWHLKRAIAMRKTKRQMYF